MNKFIYLFCIKIGPVPDVIIIIFNYYYYYYIIFNYYNYKWSLYCDIYTGVYYPIYCISHHNMIKRRILLKDTLSVGLLIHIHVSLINGSYHFSSPNRTQIFKNITFYYLRISRIYDYSIPSLLYFIISRTSKIVGLIN